jgi:norsolorinic acid ketoreductase
MTVLIPLSPIPGLGKGLVSAYLQKPDNVVIAAVRNPTDSTSLVLQDLPKHPSSTLIIVKIESTSETDPALAMAELSTKYNITTLDVVIANAGISQIYPAVADAKAEDMMKHFHVNVVGVVFLFQAVLPLLRQTLASASPNSMPQQQQQQRQAKFVTMSTSAATIGNQEHVPVPNAAYGPSKAALNWITKKIHLENPDIIAFPLDPG